MKQHIWAILFITSFTVALGIAAIMELPIYHLKFSTHDDVVCGCLVLNEGVRIVECEDDVKTMDFIVSKCE